MHFSIPESEEFQDKTGNSFNVIQFFFYFINDISIITLKYVYSSTPFQLMEPNTALYDLVN